MSKIDLGSLLREKSMLIPDEIKQCVAFLLCKRRTEMHLAGTVFFVGVAIPDTNRMVVYAITAKHVIDAIKEHGDNEEVIFRLNKTDGNFLLLSTKCADWVTHPFDSSVDVAICPVGNLPENVEFKIYPANSFLTKQIIEREKIGIGEEVFTVGLFTQHSGKNKNIPIVRVGNIAAMPEEKIGHIDGYIIEARSFGGLSGSPVFAHLGVTRNIDGSTRFANSAYGIFYLLGLIHGHWDESIILSDIPMLDSLKQEVKKVNYGLAVAVPSEIILEVLNQDKLRNIRDQLKKEFLQQQLPTANTPPAEENFHESVK